MFDNQYVQNQWARTLEVSIEDLRNAVDTLQSLEVSNEGVIDAVTAVFSKSFNALRMTIKEKFFTQEQKLLGLDENQIRKLSKDKMSKSYTYLLDRPVSVPSGMKSTYLVYASHSLVMSEYYKKIASVVEQLRSDIGTVISTPNGVKDGTLFNDAFYIKEKKEVDKLNEALGRLRNGDDFNSVRNYGDVFRNNNELFETLNVVRKGNDNFNSVNRAKLIKNIETTMSYVEELAGIARQEGFSRPLVNRIGNAVAIVAEISESFGAATFNQEMVCTALNNVTKEISDKIFVAQI